MGHNGNGRRCAKNAVVADGIMKVTGEANGDTGWLKHRLDRQYGRWEIRSRSQNTGASGGQYHPLHLIWPTSERWPQDGEYDWVEWFRVSGGGGPNGRQNIQTMPSGHLNVQLDNFTGSSGQRPAVFEVDWVRAYS